MNEIILQEPLTEFTADCKADILWISLDDGRLVTSNLIAGRDGWLQDLGHRSICEGPIWRTERKEGIE